MRSKLRSIWLDLWPEKQWVRAPELFRATLGVALALLVTGGITHLLSPSTQLAWLAAPVGASAVLVLAMPSSPLAQPWAVIGGNTLSAVVGLAVAVVLPDTYWAAGIAVGMALGLMFALRCVHPPGGAVALLSVMAHRSDWAFVLNPLLLNCVLLVLVATIYNRMTGRSYPVHKQEAVVLTYQSAQFTQEDIDMALRRHNELLDIGRQDLQLLLQDAQTHAFERGLGQLTCSEIMSTRLITCKGVEPVAQAWQTLMSNNIKSLPVVDEQFHVTGIITRSDFVRHWFDQGNAGSPGDDTLKVRDWMTRKVRVASDNIRLIELLPLFSKEGHHHIPIVNAQHKLVGIITESDVVRALGRSLVVG